MNPENERQLEARIDRALRALPELPAPRTLSPRVWKAIAGSAQAPWYRQSWQMWPIALRAGSLVLLLAGFAALCFAGSKLPQAGGFVSLLHGVASCFSGLSALWHTLNALLGALALAGKQLGTGFLIGCLLSLAFGYALCIGLGTLFVRLALTGKNTANL